jgi:hypothetical protein
MPDRRQVLRAVLLAGAGLALPAACGVPSGGRPVVDGNGPPYDPVGGQQGEPPDPSDADSPTKLVELFLAAVSGALETSEQQTAAGNRARAFLSPDTTKSWQPDVTKVTVVRVESLTNTTVGRDLTTVSCTLLTVGRFDGSRGLVDRSLDVGPAPVTVEFTVVPNADRSGFLISKLPDLALSGLVLSTAALDELYFTPQLVYFWDTNRRALVPDLRYVPRAGVPASQQRADIVRWLLGGPSDLISPVAIKIMPDGADLSLPNVLTESDRLVVDMTGAFQAADLGKVMSELRWSLNPLYLLDSGTIELQIASRPQQVDGTAAPYIADNPADAAYRDVEARPFCVVGGQVYPVEAGYGVPSVLANVARPVVQAAVSRDRQQSALVCGDKNAKRLWLGQGNKAGGASYTDSGLTGQSWSRPAFLPSGRRILVIVDGTLYAVTAGVASPVEYDVRAFSVAPDGYRIALVRGDGAGAVLQVGALRDTGDRLAATSLRPLDPGLTGLRAVAWTRLDRVLVSGHTPEGDRLAEVTIDGAIQTAWTGRPFKDVVSWVVAYPTLPSQLAGSGPVLVQTNKGEAFRVFANSDPVPLVVQSPSPRPSQSTVVPPAPTAPFFVD